MTVASGNICASSGKRAMLALFFIGSARWLASGPHRNRMIFRMLLARKSSPSGFRSLACQSFDGIVAIVPRPEGAPDYLLERLRAVISDGDPVAVGAFAKTAGLAKRRAHPGPDHRRHNEGHVAVACAASEGNRSSALSSTGVPARGNEVTKIGRRAGWRKVPGREEFSSRSAAASCTDGWANASRCTNRSRR